jgi:hypothetical protein
MQLNLDQTPGSLASIRITTCHFKLKFPMSEHTSLVNALNPTEKHTPTRNITTSEVFSDAGARTISP